MSGPKQPNDHSPKSGPLILASICTAPFAIACLLAIVASFTGKIVFRDLYFLAVIFFPLLLLIALCVLISIVVALFLTPRYWPVLLLYLLLVIAFLLGLAQSGPW